MATRPLTIAEYQETYRNIVRLAAERNETNLTDFSEGSMHDIISGAFSVALNEISEFLLTEFTKLYFDTAEGESLEALAVDRFGNAFARPQGTTSSVFVEFSRPRTNTGEVEIPAGTIIATQIDANGENVRFETTQTVNLLDDLTVTASAQSTEIGPQNNVAAGTITLLESPLLDPFITVNNPSAAAGGTNVEEDAEYRETIKNLINTLRGATKSAIEGALLAVPEIRFVSLVEELAAVVEYDIANDRIQQNEEGENVSFFRIPLPRAYVADSEGNFGPDLIEAARLAIQNIRACGVSVQIIGARTGTVDFTGSIVLSSGGPNREELTRDTSLIVESMREYINNILEIGEGFSVNAAQSYIFGIWGPTGTGDLTTFNVDTPVVDIAGDVGVKLVAGNVGIT